MLALPGVHFHDYGKAPRAGRKLGHCTIVARTAAERDRLAAQSIAAAAALGRRTTAKSAGAYGVFVTGVAGRAPTRLPYSTGRSNEHPHVPRPFQAHGTAFPAQPGPGVPVSEPDPLPRQGVHGVHHLVHGRLCRDHGRNRFRQDHPDRNVPEGNRAGRRRRPDQPDADLADRVPADAARAVRVQPVPHAQGRAARHPE